MIHLEYPRKRGFIYWDELRCLARALGFPVDAFYNRIPESITGKEPGVTTTEFLDMLDKQKLFHFVLDMTFNIHTDEWNIATIKKSVPLLDNHVLSFEDLQSIRLAFQTYECPDTRGMMIDEKTLLRAIKMCGRMISPLKMMHRIKHMIDQLEDEERIQLHEFLDLLMWCDSYQGMKAGPRDYDMSKDDRQMFKMENFSEILSHHDERLHERLDQDYIKQEWNFAKEKHDIKKDMPKDIPPVNPDIRKTLVDYHKQRYTHLHQKIKDAQSRVYQAKAGYVRGRPVSAPELEMYSEKVELLSGSGPPPDIRPPTVLEVGGHLIRTPTPTQGKTGQETRCEVPRPHLRSHQHGDVEPAVTPTNIRHKQEDVDALRFSMETVGHKYRRILDEELDIMIPGFRERTKTEDRRPKSVPLPERPRTKQTKASSSRQDVDHQSLPASNALSTHGKSCDARYRGWYSANNKPGHHFVLVEPSYDNTLQGQMMAKMKQQRELEVPTTRHVYRYTSGSQAAGQGTMSSRSSVGGSSQRKPKEKEASQPLDAKGGNGESTPKLVVSDSTTEEFEKETTQTLRKFTSSTKLDELKEFSLPSPKDYSEGTVKSPKYKKGRVPFLGQIAELSDGEEEELAPHLAEGNQPHCSTPSTVSDASFLSMDMTFNPELRKLSKKGPQWLDELLRPKGDVRPVSAKTSRAYRRIVNRFDGSLSADFKRKLHASVVY